MVASRENFEPTEQENDGSYDKPLYSEGGSIRSGIIIVRGDSDLRLLAGLDG